MRERRIYKAYPVWMEDFAVTCPLVPGIPHLRSGSCTSPRIFGLGFLQTTPRNAALALLLTFGSTNTWYRDLHPVSYVPCPAHTAWLTGFKTERSLYVENVIPLKLKLLKKGAFFNPVEPIVMQLSMPMTKSF